MSFVGLWKPEVGAIITYDWYWLVVDALDILYKYIEELNKRLSRLEASVGGLLALNIRRNPKFMNRDVRCIKSRFYGVERVLAIPDDLIVNDVNGEPIGIRYNLFKVEKRNAKVYTLFDSGL